MMRVAYERITVDPHKMRGLPIIRDTRVTVSAVLGRQWDDRLLAGPGGGGRA